MGEIPALAQLSRPHQRHAARGAHATNAQPLRPAGLPLDNPPDFPPSLRSEETGEIAYDSGHEEKFSGKARGQGTGKEGPREKGAGSKGVRRKAPAKPAAEARQNISVTTDIVIFTFEEQQLKVLLVRRATPPFEGLWAFPGGYLEGKEELDTCAARELKEETGLTGARLKQWGAVGTVGRDPRGRCVTVVYFGAVSSEISKPRVGDEVDEAAFHAVKRRPRLAFDHEQIVKHLLNVLKDEITQSEILFDFFRSVIPSTDMLALIEQIWGTTADRRKSEGFMHSLPFLQEMSGGTRFRLDRTEMRRWLEPTACASPTS